jgi:L-asparaginase II
MSARYRGGVPIADVVRTGFTEGRHHGSVAILDASGTLVASIGDAQGPIFPRSSNKPVQATAMLRCGFEPAEPAELAIVAASHRGEPRHIERIRALLARAGLTEDYLQCPPDLPIGERAREDVLRAGGEPQRVLMNCSGKHSGMLATCQAAGWSLGDYRDPGHPLQKACRDAVQDLTGETVAAVGVDGCGAPVMAISLIGLARAFLAAVSAPVGTPERRVADAMRAHPEMVSGEGGHDTMLMRAIPGLLSKGGAEGVLAAALPGVGAVALKIDDGAGRATVPVLAAALACLGLPAAVPDELARTPVYGGGQRVGSVTATLPAL